MRQGLFTCCNFPYASVGKSYSPEYLQGFVCVPIQLQQMMASCIVVGLHFVSNTLNTKDRV